MDGNPTGPLTGRLQNRIAWAKGRRTSRESLRRAGADAAAKEVVLARRGGCLAPGCPAMAATPMLGAGGCAIEKAEDGLTTAESHVQGARTNPETLTATTVDVASAAARVKDGFSTPESSTTAS